MQIIRITPSHWRSLALYAAVLLILEPAFIVAHYGWNEEMGAYPSNADSIGIPISQDLIAWCVWMPIGALVVAWALRGYPGAVSLWTWNPHRSAWSIVWSTLFAFMIAGNLSTVPYDLRWFNFPTLINIGLWILLYLWLRAIIVAKKGWK